MPSLKSSIGSKSTTFNYSVPAGVGGECFVFRQEDRFNALHSSWINRLHVRIPPSSAAVYPGGSRIHTAGGGGDIVTGEVPPNNRTVSIEKFRTPSSSFHSAMPSSIAPRFLGSPQRKPQISLGDADGLLVSGFGPFKVRERRKRTGRVFEKGAFTGDEYLTMFPREKQEAEHGVVGVLATKLRDEALQARQYPFLQKLRPRLGRIGSQDKEKGIVGLDPASFSGLQTCFGPWKIEKRLKTTCQATNSQFRGCYQDKSPVFGPVLEIRSVGHPASSRGSAFHDLSDDASVSRISQNGHNLNRKTRQPGLQDGTKEPEEPFSFWNMGRFNRTSFVSSVSPSFDLPYNSIRKRKPSPHDIIRSPERPRTRCEDQRR